MLTLSTNPQFVRSSSGSATLRAVPKHVCAHPCPHLWELCCSFCICFCCFFIGVDTSGPPLLSDRSISADFFSSLDLPGIRPFIRISLVLWSISRQRSVRTAEAETNLYITISITVHLNIMLVFLRTNSPIFAQFLFFFFKVPQSLNQHKTLQTEGKYIIAVRKWVLLVYLFLNTVHGRTTKKKQQR